ncbi:MAG TPA: GAF domain-containing sensor histidine kinase [Candidatus Dormibacteraeota bacterium]|jgi:signal transduction histidine kinase
MAAEKQAAAARLIWVGLALLGLGLALASIPAEWRHFMTVCGGGAACSEPHLTPARVEQLRAFGLPATAFAAYLLMIESLWAVTYIAVGATIIWRRSDQAMAVLAALFLLTFGLSDSFLGAGGAPYEGRPLIVQAFEFVGFGSLLLFLFLFPQGRFVPRWSAWLALLAIAWQVGETFFRTSGLSTQSWPPLLAYLPTLLTLGSVVAVQVYRHLRVSDAVERQQAKWVVFGVIVTVLGFLAIGVLIAVTGPSPQNVFVFLAGATTYYLVLLPLPVSIAVAVLRHRLWGVDVILNRTLVYGALTALVVGIFVLIVGGLGQLFNSKGNPVLSLLATALLAVLFQPMRERLQKAANRLVYGERDEPYVALSQLGQRLEATLAQDAVLTTIVDTVATTLKLPYAAIALERDGGYHTVAACGVADGDQLDLPLTYRGETIGRLLVSHRPGEAGFSAADNRLLEDLARQAGVAAYAVRLTAEIQHARERLVTAREEERRRLRRDLHDGLGPTMASLTLMAEAAGNLLSRDPLAAAELLQELKDEAKAATAEIRRVVYELRPPALDELGLVAAIREQADQYRRAGLQVSILAPESLPPLPAAVEVAAYRIVQESMTNVVRHAGARTCTVRLEVENGLQVEITDDGRGLNGGMPGVGLASMRERAAELGGSCVIEAASGGGTLVRARLPMRDG